LHATDIISELAGHIAACRCRRVFASQFLAADGAISACASYEAPSFFFSSPLMPASIAFACRKIAPPIDYFLH
jgi:hypothetical protein